MYMHLHTCTHIQVQERGVSDGQGGGRESSAGEHRQPAQTHALHGRPTPGPAKVRTILYCTVDDVCVL